ncbi:DUF3169 family protein [Clostridium sp. Marseille-P2415]|uniref:DUF3169 family protein n=1 Tax=Clostridium sp. Marseille-P2415 TaxID=1805471 RepID=UPI0013565CA5|nr:DUF3169 family protein [Clostridium sp. Marseille-P2415]
MNNEKIREIRTEDKRALHKYIIIMIIALLVGLIIGFLSNILEGNAAEWIAGNLLVFLERFYPVANIVITIVLMLPVIYLYKKSRKLYQAWDGESEGEINQVEINLSYALWFTSILLVLSFFFFSVGFYINIYDASEYLSRADKICWFTGFLAAIVCTIIAQQKIVNFEKEINPEKQGSVFDQKFAKKWEESCDEAERMTIYKSAYRSFQAVTVTCLILWLFCVIGANIWNFGLMPVTVITVIWLVQVSSYCMEAIRQSKNSLK